MKQLEDKFRERLEGYEMKLPPMDQQAFWDRKANHERAAKRRRSFLSVAVGLPAAAAILIVLVMSINLLSIQKPAVSDESELFAQLTTPMVTIASGAEIMEIACIEDADQDNMTSSDYKSLEFEEDVFMLVEKMPEFPGGTTALTDYLKEETIYPEQAREDSIQGRVLLSFVVEKDGSISNPTVVKSSGNNRRNPENSDLFDQLDAEALRVLSQMPKWNPGMDNGALCRVQYAIPINFRLN